MLQPGFDLQFDLVADPGKLSEHLVFENVLASRVVEDPGQGRSYSREGLRALLFGTGESQNIRSHKNSYTRSPFDHENEQQIPATSPPER